MAEVLQNGKLLAQQKSQMQNHRPSNRDGAQEKNHRKQLAYKSVLAQRHYETHVCIHE